jgi:hypothetical protein
MGEFRPAPCLRPEVPAPQKWKKRAAAARPRVREAPQTNLYKYLLCVQKATS